MAISYMEGEGIMAPLTGQFLPVDAPKNRFRWSTS